MISNTLPDPNRGLAGVLWVYQRERFPLLAYVPLVLVFTASAVLYAHYATGFETAALPSVLDFAVAALTILGIFLLMRIADEFKDAKDDARYRPYRPVPRGLVTLKQLDKIAAYIVAFIVVANTLCCPPLLPALALTLTYLCLMSKEFGAGEWLRGRPLIYAATHMVILVLMAAYAAAIGGDLGAPGITAFLALTYANGFVLELGRKIRDPLAEETGVDTYSALYGLGTATVFWSVAVTAATIFALIALHALDLTTFSSFATLVVAGAFTCLVTVRVHPRSIETVSGVWLLASYLIVGAAPVLTALAANL